MPPSYLLLMSIQVRIKAQLEKQNRHIRESEANRKDEHIEDMRAKDEHIEDMRAKDEHIEENNIQSLK